MPSFHYVGLDEQGQSTSGTISAPTRSVAMQRIRSQGKIPTELHANMGSKGSKKAESDVANDIETTGRPTIPRVELANLIREIATAVEAGLPLMQGLQTVRRQAAGKKQAVILDFLIAPFIYQSIVKKNTCWWLIITLVLFPFINLIRAVLLVQ